MMFAISVLSDCYLANHQGGHDMVEVKFLNEEVKEVELAVGDYGVCWEIKDGKGYDGTNAGGMDWDGVSIEDMETYITLKDKIIVQVKELYQFMRLREVDYKMIYEEREFLEAA